MEKGQEQDGVDVLVNEGKVHGEEGNKHRGRREDWSGGNGSSMLKTGEGGRSSGISNRALEKESEFGDERGWKEEDVGGTGREEKRLESERERENSSGKRASSVEQWECIAVLIRVARWEMTICLLLFFIRTPAPLVQKALHTQRDTFSPTSTAGN